MNAPQNDDPMTEGELDMIEMLASGWLARRDRGLTPEEMVEFARWRSTDPRHEAAVRELDAMWDALEDLSAAQAQAPKAKAAAVKPAPARRRSWAPWALAAAAAIALAASVTVWKSRTTEPAMAALHYETAVGEQRSVALSDGSTLRLNTDSVVDVRFVTGERRLELVRGEAQFNVAKDASRPFIVTGAGIEAKALGTVFIVRRKENATELVVTEGRVKFGAVADESAAKEVAAGQVATCDARDPQSVRVETLNQAALARRVAWESGNLICRPDMPLAEFAEDFNRYHRQKLVLQDAATAATPMAGVFPLAKLNDVVNSLEKNFDLIVAHRDAERIELKKR